MAASCVEGFICVGNGKVSGFGSAFSTNCVPEKLIIATIRNRIRDPFHNHLLMFISNWTPFTGFSVFLTMVLLNLDLRVAPQGVPRIVAVHSVVAVAAPHPVVTAHRN